MDDKQLKACVDYINANAAALHGVPAKDLDIGPDIKVENVVHATLQAETATLIVSRGVKGTPKYILDLEEVKKGVAPKKSSEAVEAEAKKVDTLQAGLKGK
jgi:hypothetical protein